MASIRTAHFDEIFISPTRQRKDLKAEKIIELAGSITQVGLLHPPIFRVDSESNLVLVAGERRIRAMEYVWNFGQKVRCAGHEYEPYIIPYLDIGDVDPIDAEEAELDENLRRENLTWQEQSAATSRLLKLRAAQAERDGKPQPVLMDIVREVADQRGTQPQGTVYKDVRQNLLLADHLHKPEIAKAPNADAAMKILKRQEEADKNAKLAESVGRTLTAQSHTLLQGDCTELLSSLPNASFDVILSDPPYGMGADEFNDSGGHAGGGTDGGHFYKDDYDTWVTLMTMFLMEINRVTKPQAHLYLFCDFERFTELKQLLSMHANKEWRSFRTPLIWHNPTSNRAPWPEEGPHRKYQCVLYANKGHRPVTKLYPDVVTFPSDPNMGHHAQKPVGLFTDLLRRSINPGDTVLDPFCGTGTIFPAAHSLKCLATGIELDPSAAGIAAKRLGELK